MHLKKIVLASVMIGAAIAMVAPASAYTACNRQGDCWHTDSRVKFPGVSLSIHNDKWWDTNRNNNRYHWHDSDKDHDWHHGYWAKGEWHSS